MLAVRDLLTEVAFEPGTLFDRLQAVNRMVVVSPGMICHFLFWLLLENCKQ